MNRKVVSVVVALVLLISSLPVLADAQTSAHDSQGIIAITDPPSPDMRKSGGDPQADLLPAISVPDMRKSGGDPQSDLLPAV